MTFLGWLNTHKTKITGLAIAMLGVVQAQAALIQPLLSPRAYALLMVLTGMLVTGLGFLNSRSPS